MLVESRTTWTTSAGLSHIQELLLTSAAPYNMVDLADVWLSDWLPIQINELCWQGSQAVIQSGEGHVLSS